MVDIKKTLLFLILLLLISPLHIQARDVNDRFRSELWYLDRIAAPDAWDLETGSEQTIIAVLDAGFDLDHEDLVGQYWVNEDEIAGNQTDNDRNGYEDDVMGWDFVDSDPDPSPEVVEGGSDTVLSHGTVIAGIIGATANNGLGITGINWDVRIMPLRVLNAQGVGSTSAVREAVIYAVENGADVINLSITFTQSDERLLETLQWAHDQGVVIVASVGNGGIDTDQQAVYPACFDQDTGHNIIIGVASTDRLDQRASFSNAGAGCTDLSAPGVDVFATVYHDALIPSFLTSYASPWEGTSLSAPMVSAVAGLLISRYPSLTPTQVQHALKLSVDPVAEESLEERKRLGAGRLNSARALEYAGVFAGERRSAVSSSVISSDSFVVTQGAGTSPVVRTVNGQGVVLAEFLAYDRAFMGGVRTAMGDVDGDGQSEIIAGAGPGGGPQVRIFDLNGTVKNQFFAFDEADRLGIFVAVGDVNGDGVDEILVTSDQGGTGQVRIFDRHGNLKGSFFPQGRTSSAVRLAVADMNGDGIQDIVSLRTTASEGWVFVHSGTGHYLNSFLVFDGRVDTLTLAVGDVDQDGDPEVLVAGGVGHVPKVTVYAVSGQEKGSFFAFPHLFRGGVELAVGDIDGNGSIEIYVTATQGGPQVRIFNGWMNLIGGFFAFDQTNRSGAMSSIN